MARTKINKVFVIGTIQEVDTQIRQTADGRDYINGKVIVKVTADGAESLVELKVLAFAKKKDGGDNAMFASYSKLEGYLGKRVKISAELRDGNMVLPDGSAVRHFNEIYLKFVNNAKADEFDCATFEYSGFVTKALYERKNKNDELIGYRLDVAQANYNDTNISVIHFDINKEDLNIAQVIESAYTVGSTVSFSGVISYVSTTETKMEEVAFGNPIAKTFTRVDKVFRITGGNEPFGEDDPATYPMDEIKKYVEAYKTADAERIERAAMSADEVSAAPVSPAGKAMSNLTRSSSLI